MSHKQSTYSTFSTRVTPQSQPVPGENMIKNKAGGYAFQADDWTRLRRFLILGSDAGTYYTKAQELTKENAAVVLRCIQEDGWRAVSTIVEVSEGGLAPSNDPAIFALAMAASFGDEATKETAYNALPLVCRIGTHLFHFATYVQNFRGWGRGLRKAVAKWYLGQDADDMVFQMVKYRQRDGWDHSDLLRLSHPKPTNLVQTVAFKWAVGKGFEDSEYPHSLAPIRYYEIIKRVKTVKEVVYLLRESRLPWEVIPTEWHKEREVWEVLLESMPPAALIRNLNRFAALGMTDSNMSETTKLIVERLTNGEMIQRSRLHPFKIVSSLMTYKQGHGDKGKLTWVPNGRIQDALDTAFYLAMKNVQPTGKKLLVAVDESGSMSSKVTGSVPMSAYEAAMVMALVIAKTEPNVDFIGFDTRMRALGIAPKSTLREIFNRRASGGGTDCAIPFAYALGFKELTYDGIVLLTDSESWAGGQHVFQAANDYRRTRNENLRFITGQFTASGTTLSKPGTALDLEVVGLDASVPELMTAFLNAQF